MKCREFEPIIIGLARGRAVEAMASATALAHLDRCALCVSAFEEQLALTAGIRVATESLANQGASPRVEDALRRAFREQAGRLKAQAPAYRASGRASVIWRWSWRLAGAAAILLLALLAGVGRLESLPANQKQAATDLPAESSIAVPGQKQNSRTRADERGDHNQNTARKSANSRRLSERRGVRPGAPLADGVTTSFYPLFEEGEMVPLESGMIVRVEAPVSTLITFGLPITAENIARPVQADILLGQDGLARAIRFLP
ncbi:MAG TPA: hypothetical protein VFS27_01420 [Blastocatellia bacterium]|jgi:hypothetical protein|nr:hypothetical protein [Blastocatellia bacterium]